MDQGVGGAISMVDKGTKSLPMVAIFMTLADAVCVGFKIIFPLRHLNTFSRGYNIVTRSSKERSRPGSGLLIALGAM